MYSSIESSMVSITFLKASKSIFATHALRKSRADKPSTFSAYLKAEKLINTKEITIAAMKIMNMKSFMLTYFCLFMLFAP
ncbi:MAG: hypothetical protein ABDH59_01470 [Fervidobacterium sp.]